MKIENNNNNIQVLGATEHNLKNIDINLPRGKIIAITGISGSGKSSLAFDTILAEAQRKFFYTLSHYSRMFLKINSRPSVRKIIGLSPAIALAQYESPPSKQASVATLTDLNELMGILFSQYGKPYCPKHKKLTVSLSEKEVVTSICRKFVKKFVAICIPIATQKKGTYQKILNRLTEKGFLRVYCDGEIVPLPFNLKLDQEKKHTLKLIIDYVNISNTATTRLVNSICTALNEGQGYIECYPSNTEGKLDIKQGASYSTIAGCPVCGYSWQKMEARYFSANSLGKCTSCQGLGIISNEQELTFLTYPVCLDCSGTGIDQNYSTILIADQSIQTLYQLTVKQLAQTITNLKKDNPAFTHLKSELLKVLQSLINLGLGYLTLHRKISSLSTGEHQRIKLSGILSKQLTGVLYILDEPSQGLHLHDLNALYTNLLALKKAGNTIIIVDHDPLLLKQVDWIIDMGPEGGQKGGRIIAEFSPRNKKQFIDVSLTAKYLSQTNSYTIHNHKRKEANYIKITAAHRNNLNISSVQFLKNSLNVVTGVSGAGKTSLVIQTLYKNIYLQLHSLKKIHEWLYCKDIKGIDDIDTVLLIDRSPLSKTSVSMPATYLDIFTDIRKLFASLPAAKMMGFNARDFSLRSSSGTCSECKGRGYMLLTMKFLEDAKIKCPLCQGQRFQDVILNVHYKGLSIANILDLTISEASKLFKNFKKIITKLQAAQLLGLGYLKIGQTMLSLSGGEAQRLKLVPYLRQTTTTSTLLIIDEPTRGLHEHDATLLIMALQKIIDTGATIVMTEHHAGIIKQADWLVDIGPKAADAGGLLLYEGPPYGLSQCKQSLTATLLD